MIMTKELQCVNGCGYLIPTEYEQTSVQVCPLCKGIWLHYDELHAIINKTDKNWSHEQRSQVLAETGKTGVPKQEMERHIDCPECGQLMLAVNYQYSSGIIIHKCKYHHGVWLDSGELNEMQIYKEHCNSLKFTH